MQVLPTKELMMQSGRVLKQLLPGLGLRASILTKATAAGTEFDKVRANEWGVARVGGGRGASAWRGCKGWRGRLCLYAWEGSFRLVKSNLTSNAGLMNGSLSCACALAPAPKAVSSNIYSC